VAPAPVQFGVRAETDQLLPTRARDRIFNEDRNVRVAEQLVICLPQRVGIIIVRRLQLRKCGAVALSPGLVRFGQVKQLGERDTAWPSRPAEVFGQVVRRVKASESGSVFRVDDTQPSLVGGWFFAAIAVLILRVIVIHEEGQQASRRERAAGKGLVELCQIQLGEKLKRASTATRPLRTWGQIRL